MWKFQIQPRQDVEDPSQSNWVHLLPGLEGMEILKVGAQRFENVKSLAHRAQKGVSCVGEHSPALNGYLRVSYGSLDRVPRNAFDLVVVDEEGFFSTQRTRETFSSDLQSIVSVLKEGGRVLLCLPPGARLAKFRYWLHREAPGAGLDSVRYYFCDPSSQLPLIIVPFSENRGLAIRYLCDLDPGASPGRWLRRRVKRALYAALSIYNPRMGLLALAQKPSPPGAPETASLYEKVRRCGLAAPASTESSIVVLSTRRYEARTVFFVYDADAKMRAVAKLIDHRYYGADRLKAELHNLVHLTSCRAALEQTNLLLPWLRHCEVSEQSTLFVFEAVPGERLDGVIGRCFRRGERSVITTIMESFAGAQETLQKALTDKLASGIRRIESRYFENYLHFPDLQQSLTRVAALGFESVQHGDYTTVNTHFDLSKRQCGIIDWEWMASGYPPLFDLFSFFRSMGYVENRCAGKGWEDQSFRSFAETFFRENWFSRTQRELILRHSKTFGVSPDNVFDCFLAFLLFQFNKYRLEDVAWVEFVKLYEDMVRFAVQNKDHFILRRERL
jgi:hypothetical protein